MSSKIMSRIKQLRHNGHLFTFCVLLKHDIGQQPLLVTYRSNRDFTMIKCVIVSATDS